MAHRLQPAIAWDRGELESTLPLIDEPGPGWDTDARGDSVQGPLAGIKSAIVTLPSETGRATASEGMGWQGLV